MVSTGIPGVDLIFPLFYVILRSLCGLRGFPVAQMCQICLDLIEIGSFDHLLLASTTSVHCIQLCHFSNFSNC